jgi:tetratricopeptide (TPR) repeat protein
MLAGLVSSLLVFWVDAQVNIPVLTTRLISFAIAALILVVADDIVRRDSTGSELDSAPADNIWVWGVGCALVATLASCLPVSLLDPHTNTQDVHWLRRAAPVLALVCATTMFACQRAHRISAAMSIWPVIAGTLLFYTACYYALVMLPNPELGIGQVRTISIASCAGAVFIFAMCIACAHYSVKRDVPSADTPLDSRTARWLAVTVAAAVFFVANLNWRAVQADVASALAHQAVAKQPQLGEQFIEESIRLLPHERYYRRQQVFDLLGRAVADIRSLDKAPGRVPIVIRNLAAAETAARAAVQLFPRDPWVIVALANVLQVEALRALRPLDPAGGLRAAQEADQLFAHAHLMFPSEPLLLRNWAQLLFDQGGVPDAYRLLDLMEKLIPNDPEPYSERIVMADQISDYITIRETLARARVMLEPNEFGKLRTVAKQQQY